MIAEYPDYGLPGFRIFRLTSILNRAAQLLKGVERDLLLQPNLFD